MVRTAVFSFINLIILCSIASEISLAVASYTPTQVITASGTIIQKESEIKFLKSINVWGFTSLMPQEFIEHVAKFDLIATSFEIKESARQIKQLNPEALILGYKDVMGINTQTDDYQEVNQHEDWFVHDIYGNRLVNKDWGWYCMDVGNQGWRQHCVDYLKEKFDLYAFDGVFADDVWSQLWKEAWTVPPEDVPDYPDWHQQMIGFIQYVRLQINPKIFISNTPNNDDYVDVSDGKVWEGLGQYNAEITVLDISSLARRSAEGKYCLVWSKNYQEDTFSSMQYGLSCYLLGVNGSKAYFGWNNVWSESKGYYPEFEDVKLLGNALNEYYSYQSVYARDFENGKVLLNPSWNTHTVNLQETYVTLNGETVTEIIMEGHSGTILKKG